MNALTTFDFEGDPVRFVSIDGREAAICKDIASRLGIQNYRDVLADTPDDEKGVDSVDTLGGAQEMAVLFEPGIYRMIFKSRKPEAERLRRWVFHDVLPAIRRTGAYDRRVLGPDEMAAALSLIREVRLTHGIASARAMWPTLGLPDIAASPACDRPVTGRDAERAARTALVQDFMQSCCEVDASARVGSTALWGAYQRWRDATGSDEIIRTHKAFSLAIQSCGFHSVHSNTVHFLGLRLRTDVVRRLGATAFSVDDRP